jgi:hypothetical protein
MNRKCSSLKLALLAALVLLITASCATRRPSTPGQNPGLVSESKSAMQSMLLRNDRLKALVEQSAGYAVFPNVGKGGGLGRGAVFTRGGSLAGYPRLTRGSLVGVDGASAYDVVIAFETNLDVARFVNAKEFTAVADATFVAGDANAVIGVGNEDEDSFANTGFDNGVAVFAMPRHEVMAQANRETPEASPHTAEAAPNTAEASSNTAEAFSDAQPFDFEKPTVATTQPSTNPATDPVADDSDTAELPRE